MQAAFIKRAARASGACVAGAAALLAGGLARAQQVTPFRPERFDEVWPEDAEAPYGAQFKNLHAGDDVALSFGGDGRWRFSALDAPRLGLGGLDADEWLLQRLLLHADVRVGDGLRAFVQIGAHNGVSREMPSPTDDGGVDLAQGFVDLNGEIGGAHATLRLGRQELALGPRFITTRDSGNVRQRHDMARLIVSEGGWRADVFAGRPTTVAPHAFDDRADPGEEFYGVRLQRVADGVTAEALAYELDRDDVPLGGVTARDERLSLAARVSGRAGAYEFDAEAVFQSGVFGSDDVRAAGGVIELSRSFADAPLSPKLGGRFTYGSGDDGAGDGEQGTFAPAFPNGSWFGQNGLASFSNTVEAAALLTLTPAETVALTSKLAVVWRADTADFLYAGSAPLAGTSGGEEAFTGAALSASLVWRPFPNLSVNPYLSYVAVSDELASRGAHDVAYAHLTISVRF